MAKETKKAAPAAPIVEPALEMADNAPFNVQADVEQQLNEVPEVVEENPFSKKHYQEWRVEIKDKKAEKLKVLRPRVMITDEQAAILNQGVLEGPQNTYASMYYRAKE
jgi:hypothetical protein